MTPWRPWRPADEGWLRSCLHHRGAPLDRQRLLAVLVLVVASGTQDFKEHLGVEPCALTVQGLSVEMGLW